ncbi:chain length determinant protein [Pontibacter beigongshangensis]|uniref:chain length determinant protein n=1 Tax=Pontibacter beigongshangensis TaxID=2574733 RepID=UPI001650495C|nr:chain length determinant protein [Pontibacter beigongshangensis]
MLKEQKEEVRVFSSKNESSEEVDLGAFFQLLRRGLRSIGNFFGYLIHLIFRKILVIGLFMAIGLGISYIMYKLAKPFYTSYMTVSLAEIRNDFVGGQLGVLEQMVNEDNFEALSDRLDISLQAAQQIKSLKFTNLDEDIIEEDSVLTGSPIRIELKLYDNTLFTAMEPAITNFLENNPYFSKQKLIRENRYRKLIGKYRNDVKSIDSIKTSLIKPAGPVNGFVYGEPLDPTELYREGISIYKFQVEMEGELDRIESIQVVNSFAPKLRPNGPNLKLHLLVGALISLIIGLIMAHFLETRKKARI